MASNLGNILALLITIPLIMLLGDASFIQSKYIALENIATQISFVIQKEGKITNELIQYVEDTYYVDFKNETSANVGFGDFISFSILHSYTGLFDNREYLIRVSRTIVIGYIE